MSQSLKANSIFSWHNFNFEIKGAGDGLWNQGETIKNNNNNFNFEIKGAGDGLWNQGETIKKNTIIGHYKGRQVNII